MLVECTRVLWCSEEDLGYERAFEGMGLYPVLIVRYA